MDETIYKILPTRLRIPISSAVNEYTEEIRLRMGQKPTVMRRGREYTVNIGGHPIHQQDFAYILSAAAGASLYAVNDSLRQGYLTLKGGHRLGICGEAVMQDGCMKTLQHISSVSIRIASDRVGIGIVPAGPTLIVGLPGSGKTTLLRDCIRKLSDEQSKRVCLVDERGEVAASLNGTPQFPVGRHTDVLTGAAKAEGMLMLLRSMNPDWIAADEITKQEDAEALAQVSYCGVSVLATAHASSVEDLYRRPVYRSIMEQRIFQTIVLLRKDHSYSVQEVTDL